MVFDGKRRINKPSNRKVGVRWPKLTELEGGRFFRILAEERFRGFFWLDSINVVGREGRKSCACILL